MMGCSHPPLILLIFRIFAWPFTRKRVLGYGKIIEERIGSQYDQYVPVHPDAADLMRLLIPNIESGRRQVQERKRLRK